MKKTVSLVKKVTVLAMRGSNRKELGIGLSEIMEGNCERDLSKKEMEMEEKTR
jgi:hypothetical protein